MDEVTPWLEAWYIPRCCQLSYTTPAQEQLATLAPSHIRMYTTWDTRVKGHADPDFKLKPLSQS